MRRGTERAWLIVFLATAALDLVPVAAARPLPAGLRLHGAIGIGADTNALTFDRGMATSTYMPYELWAAYEVRPASRTELRLQANAGGNAYSGVAPGGRDQDYGASLRLVQRLWGERRNRSSSPGLDLVIQPYWRAGRSVYTSHQLYREVVRLERRHDGEPPRRVSLGGRYNAAEVGTELGLEWRGSRGSRWELEYEAVARNYENDYRWVGLVVGGSVVNPVQRDDYAAWAVRIGTQQPLGRGLTVRARYWHDRTQWVDRASRYVDGFLVLDPSVFESQRFDTDVLRTELRWEPSRQLECSVAPAWSWRKDHAWGYWDSALWSIDTGIRYRWRRHLEVAAEYHYAHRDYSTARENFSAPVFGKPLLDDYPRAVSLEAGWRVAPHGSMVARYVYDNRNANAIRDDSGSTPIFPYERSRADVRYEFRY